jgi:hypothetical protein
LTIAHPVALGILSDHVEIFPLKIELVELADRGAVAGWELRKGSSQRPEFRVTPPRDRDGNPHGNTEIRPRRATSSPWRFVSVLAKSDAS